MSKHRNLSSVPDGAEIPDEPEAEPVKGYTITDSFRENAQLIREVSDQHKMDPAVTTLIFQTTLNFHLTKIQMGLTSPVEEHS